MKYIFIVLNIYSILLFPLNNQTIFEAWSERRSVMIIGLRKSQMKACNGHINIFDA